MKILKSLKKLKNVSTIKYILIIVCILLFFMIVKNLFFTKNMESFQNSFNVKLQKCQTNFDDSTGPDKMQYQFVAGSDPVVYMQEGASGDEELVKYNPGEPITPCLAFDQQQITPGDNNTDDSGCLIKHTTPAPIPLPNPQKCTMQQIIDDSAAKFFDNLLKIKKGEASETTTQLEGGIYGKFNLSDAFMNPNEIDDFGNNSFNVDGQQITFKELQTEIESWLQNDGSKYDLSGGTAQFLELETQNYALASNGKQGSATALQYPKNSGKKYGATTTDIANMVTNIQNSTTFKDKPVRINKAQTENPNSLFEIHKDFVRERYETYAEYLRVLDEEDTSAGPEKFPCSVDSCPKNPFIMDLKYGFGSANPPDFNGPDYNSKMKGLLNDYLTRLIQTEIPEDLTIFNKDTKKEDVVKSTRFFEEGLDQAIKNGITLNVLKVADRTNERSRFEETDYHYKNGQFLGSCDYCYGLLKSSDFKKLKDGDNVSAEFNTNFESIDFTNAEAFDFLKKNTKISKIFNDTSSISGKQILDSKIKNVQKCRLCPHDEFQILQRHMDPDTFRVFYDVGICKKCGETPKCLSERHSSTNGTPLKLFSPLHPLALDTTYLSRGSSQVKLGISQAKTFMGQDKYAELQELGGWRFGGCTNDDDYADAQGVNCELRTCSNHNDEKATLECQADDGSFDTNKCTNRKEICKFEECNYCEKPFCLPPQGKDGDIVDYAEFCRKICGNDETKCEAADAIVNEEVKNKCIKILQTGEEDAPASGSAAVLSNNNGNNVSGQEAAAGTTTGDSGAGRGVNSKGLRLTEEEDTNTVQLSEPSDSDVAVGPSREEQARLAAKAAAEAARIEAERIAAEAAAVAGAAENEGPDEREKQVASPDSPKELAEPNPKPKRGEIFITKPSGAVDITKPTEPEVESDLGWKQFGYDGVVILEYEPARTFEADIALSVDDRVYVYTETKNDLGWVFGTNKNTGEEGWFPEDYVKRVGG
jgi:hypothetical protein